MNEKPVEEAPRSVSVFSFSFSLVLLGILLFFSLANAEKGLASVTAGIFILMAGTRLWARLGLVRLRATIACDRDRLFPGESLEVRVTLENRKPLPVWAKLELPAPEALIPAEGKILGETGLLPFATALGSWSFVATKRGLYSLGPASLQAGDLLGLHRKERLLPFEREIVVFPRLVPVGGPDLSFREYFGIHPSKGLIEDPAWYAGTRDYTGNRPAKNIHWKASARLDSLQEKIFEPTSHRKVFFLLDGDGFLRERSDEDFEKTLEVVASLAARFAELGASFGIAVNLKVRGFAPVLPLGRGPEHLGRTLELLARTRAEAGMSLLGLVEKAGIAGVGFIVCAREADEKTRSYFDLPAARRNRMIFLFSRKAPGDEAAGYPAYSFRDILPAEGGEP